MTSWREGDGGTATHPGPVLVLDRDGQVNAPTTRIGQGKAKIGVCEGVVKVGGARPGCGDVPLGHAALHGTVEEGAGHRTAGHGGAPATTVCEEAPVVVKLFALPAGRFTSKVALGPWPKSRGSGCPVLS